MSDHLLFAQALWQLVRYDLVIRTFGFKRIHQGLRELPVQPKTTATVAQVCSAMTKAITWYCKPVHCLQRSAATARLLRASGCAGRLVIGYRSVPFFSHAWVEVAGKVINDAASYQSRLHVLDSI